MRIETRKILQELRRKMQRNPLGDRYVASSETAQQKLQQILELPYEQLSENSSVRLMQKRFVRIAALSVTAAVLLVVFSVRFALRPDSKPDVLALAAKKYEKRKGILALKGEAVAQHKVWMLSNERWLDNTYRSDFQVWLTTDGLYSHTLEKLKIKPAPVLQETVATPQGKCVTDSREPNVNVFQPYATLPSEQILSKSCPFGIGLQPRLHKAYPMPKEKRKYFQNDYIGSLPKSVFQTLIDPSHFLRKVRAGEFTRSEVKKALSGGVEVYVIRVWESTESTGADGKVRLRKNMKQRTLILDRHTLEIRSYSERIRVNEDGKHEGMEAYSLVFSEPPSLIPENKENGHLLRMSGAPSRVDSDPFDGRDRRINRELQHKERR